MDPRYYSFRSMKKWQIDILIECAAWDWQQIQLYAESL